MDDDRIEPKADIAAFLKELAALTIRHRIHIWGCGCCGSPNLSRIKADRPISPDAYYQISAGYGQDDDPTERLCFVRDAEAA